MNGLIPEKIYTWGLRTWNLHDTEEKAYGKFYPGVNKKRSGTSSFQEKLMQNFNWVLVSDLGILNFQGWSVT